MPNAVADGTMSGRSGSGQAVDSIRSTGSTGDGATGNAIPGSNDGAAERGVTAGRWWPPAYDSVVERWVEEGRLNHEK